MSRSPVVPTGRWYRLRIADDVHGQTGLDGPLFDTEPTVPESLSAAQDVLIDVLREHSTPVTIAATGALTNIADLLASEPELIPKIAEIVWMGGSTDRGAATRGGQRVRRPRGGGPGGPVGCPLHHVRSQRHPSGFGDGRRTGALQPIGRRLARICIEWMTFFASTYRHCGVRGAAVARSGRRRPGDGSGDRALRRGERRRRDTGRVDVRCDPGRPLQLHRPGAQRAGRCRTGSRSLLDQNRRRRHGSRLDGDDEAAVGAAGGLAMPGGGDIGERDGLVRDSDGSVRGVLQYGGQRIAALLRGDGVVGVAEHARRTAAEDREENTASSPDAPPRLTSRPPRGEHPRGRGGGDAEDRVDARRRPARRSRPAAARPGRPRRRLERNDFVGAGGRRPVPCRVRPAHGDHAPSAEQPGRADRRPGRPPRRRRARAPARPACSRPARSAPSRPPPRTARAPRPPCPGPASSSGTTSTSGTAQRSARLPSPGAIPAESRRTTPASRPAALGCSTTRPPARPGTYGSAGAPKYDVPDAHSRSSGTTGAAVTRTSDVPVGRRPGRGARRTTAAGRGCAGRRLARLRWRCPGRAA